MLTNEQHFVRRVDNHILSTETAKPNEPNDVEPTKSHSALDQEDGSLIIIEKEDESRKSETDDAVHSVCRRF